MALLKSFTITGVSGVMLDNGSFIPTGPVDQTYPNAYHRVKLVVVDKISAVIHVDILSSQQGCIVATKIFSGAPVDLNGDNNLAQAYQYLKLLPEFEGSEDV